MVTAHRRVVGHREKCQGERLKLETEVADVQSNMAVLQCQTDQVHTLQHVAENAALSVAKCKCKKRRGAVAVKKCA